MGFNIYFDIMNRYLSIEISTYLNLILNLSVRLTKEFAIAFPLAKGEKKKKK